MDKVAIVTGGSSGIGAATAALLSQRGWRVAAMARKGVTAEFQGDVAKDADCRRVAKAVLDKWGRIDALVNNATSASSASTWWARSRWCARARRR
jgi:3-oxoacyl-[acyl-carrier protein] reductase